MSGTGSLMIRNLRKASDYDKARLNQDELLKIAIANDMNISNARRAYRSGEVPALTVQQTQTPDEIQEDLSKNYSDAITNLLSLGMDYREASQIVAQLGNDPSNLVILNNTFPSIKADFLKRFDVKRITPTGFIDFFEKFREVFEETKGISDNSTLFNDKFDRIINNLNDLRAIMPTPRQFSEVNDLLRRVARTNPKLDEILQRLARLQRVIPSEQFFRDLADNSDNTQVYRDIAQLQNAMVNLPSQAELARQLDLARQGNEDAIEILINLIGSVSNREIDTILGLEEKISGQISGLSAQVEELTGESNIVADYIRGQGYLLFGKNKIYWQNPEGSLELLDASKMKTWYKKNTHKFTEWYDNVIGEDTTSMFNKVKTYILQKGRKEKVVAPREELLSPERSPPRSPERKSSSSASSATSGESGFGLRVAPLRDARDLRSRTGHGARMMIKKIGKGIAPIEEPSHIEFGKHLLHASNLKKSVLSVHHKGGGRVASIPVQNISEDLKDFVVDILQNKKASQKEFSRLPMKDQKLFEKMATGAGIFHHLGLKTPQGDDDKKNLERFEVLRGEYIAGNNSNDLIKELRKLVILFMDEGRLTKSQGRDFLLNIN